MFRELYYWLYELLKKIKTNDNPGFNAFIGISFFQCMNVLTLGGIANYFLSLDISKSTAVYSGIFLYVSLTTVNFFILFRKKDEIIKKCEKLPAERKSKGQLYFWLYALITIGFFIYVIINLVTAKY
jgi:hypothetical protein